MTVVGVDLSSRTVALVALGAEVSVVKVKVPPKITDRHEIVRRCFLETRDTLIKWSPDAVFVEEPVLAGARNIRSTIKIAMVCGAVLSAAGMERTYLVPVSSWKANTVGHGNADKSAVRAWLTAYHPEVAALCGDDQDLVDAAAVALHGQGLLSRVADLGDGLLGDT